MEVRDKMREAKYIVPGFNPELIMQDQSKSPMMTAIKSLREKNKETRSKQITVVSKQEINENKKLMRIVKSNLTPIF